jgi:hypothetical protein
MSPFPLAVLLHGTAALLAACGTPPRTAATPDAAPTTAPTPTAPPQRQAALPPADTPPADVPVIAQLDAALERAQQHDGASYIEIMIAAEESQPLPENILQQIYQSTVSSQS